MKDGPEEFTAASGARLAIPDVLRQAVRAVFQQSSVDMGAESETLYLQRLVEQLHLERIVLLPLDRSGRREMVNADLYGLALTAKFAADERVHAIGQLIGRNPEWPSLCAHFQVLVDQLTGHAPPAGVVEQLGLFEDRLRRLRFVALGTPIDAPMEDLPTEDVAAAETVAELFRGEAR